MKTEEKLDDSSETIITGRILGNYKYDDTQSHVHIDLLHPSSKQISSTLLSTNSKWLTTLDI